MPINDPVGVSMKPDKPSEAISDIADNKTMIIAKLTDEMPISPEVNTESTTVKEVFEHYKPTVNFSFKDKNDAPVDEKMTFTNVGDFGKVGITKKSNFLQKLEQDKRDYQSFSQIVKSNKILEKVMNNPEAKEAYIAVLKDMINELDNSSK
ncbi:MAG: hypothetical protein ABI844_07280 [Saprospiraceae bacterium]